ncbi:MAG TPA: hypothetical protein DCQ06_12700, partial [Myxococcales bacterium]|nr:hypothetical protein [Myxococcales bacterium]
ERAHRAQGRAIVSCVSSGTPGRDDEVRQLTPAQIEALIEAFADAACRAADAGLDGVELHGAHGYLLCQFLRADLNTRTDGWGGDLPGRARLLRRVMQTIRQQVPASFVVGVRLSAENGTFLTGLDLDESLQTAQWLCDDGADFIHVSLWDAHLNCSKRADVHPARVFRDALPEAVPVITAGQIWTRAHAHQQLDHGADAVALGRAAITTPNWPQQVVRDGKEPLMPPVSAQQLRDRDLSETFVTYMKRWPGFVHTDDGGRPAK